jgi:3',5'-cyclic AMP phosphodiesterase CpdA
VTRRRAIGEALAGTGGLAASIALAGCGGSAGRPPAASGSTLRSTWGDPVGDGQLRVGPGEPLLDRTELGPSARRVGTLATIAHLTDAHLLDACSPARVTFLNRLGAPFQSTFRPQEALTAQVLNGAGAALRALAPELVIQGGDLIDNAQSNELTNAQATLGGGRVHPGSGDGHYVGVQSAWDTDPFYYRPDDDAPRHPGLLTAAVRPFVSAGAGAAVHPVLGDHDALVAGEIVPTELTRSLALGDRALWDLPSGLTLPAGARTGALASPDGPPDPGLIDELLSRALAGPTVQVPADPRRRELSFAEVLKRLRTPAGVAGGADRLDYVLDAGPHIRLIVLDLVRRGGGSGGLVSAGQPAWLEQQLVSAGGRWVIVVSHQPLADSVGGEGLLALLDRAPLVIAALSGHTHRNQILARPTSAGGYWLISTASLIDYPQQARALRLVATARGGVAIHTWMLDHVAPGQLGTIARELSYIDAQGGRPEGFAGSHVDRNVTLYRRAVY